MSTPKTPPEGVASFDREREKLLDPEARKLLGAFDARVERRINHLEETSEGRHSHVTSELRVLARAVGSMRTSQELMRSSIVEQGKLISSLAANITNLQSGVFEAIATANTSRLEAERALEKIEDAHEKVDRVSQTNEDALAVARDLADHMLTQGEVEAERKRESTRARARRSEVVWGLVKKIGKPVAQAVGVVILTLATLVAVQMQSCSPRDIGDSLSVQR